MHIRVDLNIEIIEKGEKEQPTLSQVFKYESVPAK